MADNFTPTDRSILERLRANDPRIIKDLSEYAKKSPENLQKAQMIIQYAKQAPVEQNSALNYSAPTSTPTSGPASGKPSSAVDSLLNALKTVPGVLTNQRDLTNAEPGLVATEQTGLEPTKSTSGRGYQVVTPSGGGLTEDQTAVNTQTNINREEYGTLKDEIIKVLNKSSLRRSGVKLLQGDVVPILGQIFGPIGGTGGLVENVRENISDISKGVKKGFRGKITGEEKLSDFIKTESKSKTSKASRVRAIQRAREGYSFSINNKFYKFIDGQIVEITPTDKDLLNGDSF